MENTLLSPILEALPDLVYIMSKDGRYLELLSPNKSLSYAKWEEIQGRSVHDVLPTEIAAKISKLIERANNGAYPREIVYKLNVLEGEKWLEGKAAKIPADGFDGVIFIVRDISRRMIALREVQLQKQISETLNSTISVEEAIGTCLESICRHSEWFLGEAWFLDRGELRHVVHGASNEDGLEKFVAESKQLHFRKGDGLPGWVWKHGQMMWLRQMKSQTELKFARDVLANELNIETSVGVPIHLAGKFRGVFCFFAKEDLVKYSYRENTLTTFANQVALSIERRYAEQETEKAVKALEDLSMSDPLTGTLNRRAMIDALAAEWHRAKRGFSEFSLVMIDVDNMKTINDAFGHPAGDKALLKIVETLKSTIRPYDRVARWGGDEFMLMFPRTNLDVSREILDRIYAAMTQCDVRMGSEVVRITASAGMVNSSTIQKDSGDVEALIALADRALYLAKSKGKNDFVILGDEESNNIEPPQSL